MTTSEARPLLEELLAECGRQDASDLHLAPDLPPYLRVQGVLEPQTQLGPLSPSRLAGLADCLGATGAALERTGSFDGALSAADGTRYRFNVFRRQGQLS